MKGRILNDFALAEGRNVDIDRRVRVSCPRFRLRVAAEIDPWLIVILDPTVENR
jgi:hypothetical protein